MVVALKKISFFFTLPFGDQLSNLDPQADSELSTLVEEYHKLTSNSSS